MNLRARTYNPRWGAFTSVDPVLGVGGSTGWNGYLYANANPANLTDPSGRCIGPIALVCLGIAIVGGGFAGGLVYGTASHLSKGGNFGDALGQGVAWGLGSAFVAGMVYAPVGMTAAAAAFAPAAAGAAWSGWYATARWTLAAGGLGSAADMAWAHATEPLGYILGSAGLGAIGGQFFGQAMAAYPLTTARVGLGLSGAGVASASLSIAQNGLNPVNALDLGLAGFGAWQSAKAIGRIQTITGAKGPNSRRDFDPDQAGGPIRNLDYRKAKITHKGVDVVERHLSRFGPYKPNRGMITRLRSIASGEMLPEMVDLRFYTHELREYVRYRRLGYVVGEPNGDSAWEMWNNTHTATLEDYKLNELIDFLYHPSVGQE